MSVLILKSGLFDTIQDGGRFGFQHLGINPGGAMDLISASLANALVDNESNTPVVELHFPASVFIFTQNSLIAITGADFEPEIDDKPVPTNTAILVSKNSILKFKRMKGGARCYLAIHGKWEIPKWLNSSSTNTKVAAGGYEGRRLLKDDLINVESSKWKVKSNDNTTVILPVSVDYNPLTGGNIIRMVEGSEYGSLSEESKNQFTNASYKITLQSDRMGFRLDGIGLKRIKQSSLLSSAVTRGAIQLLPSGQLIILMADHQTTGGYPKIAHVISADQSKLAQMQPNGAFQFELIEHEAAENIFLQQQQHLQRLKEKIKFQLKQLANDH